MNKFELFTLIFFALDAYYEDEAKTDDKLNTLLSDANPFLWKENISADPAVFNGFCDFLGNREITLENSLELAKAYVKTIDFVDVSEAFKDMTEDEWIDACKEYLSTEHKGADAM